MKNPNVTVRITVPLDANGWIAPLLFAGKTVSTVTTLAHESYGTP